MIDIERFIDRYEVIVIYSYIYEVCIDIYIERETYRDVMIIID